MYAARLTPDAIRYLPRNVIIYSYCPASMDTGASFIMPIFFDRGADFVLFCDIYPRAISAYGAKEPAMTLRSVTAHPSASRSRTDVRLSASLLVALCAIAVVTPALARQKRNAPDKNTFRSLYSRRDDALRRMDISAFMRTVAPGFQSFDIDGSLYIPGRKQEKDRLVRALGRATAVESKTVVLSVSPAGSGAIVTVKFDHTRTQSDSLRGLFGRHKETGRYRDFWVKTGGVWQMERSRALVLNITKTSNGRRLE